MPAIPPLSPYPFMQEKMAQDYINWMQANGLCKGPFQQYVPIFANAVAYMVLNNLAMFYLDASGDPERIPFGPPRLNHTYMGGDLPVEPPPA